MLVQAGKNTSLTTSQERARVIRRSGRAIIFLMEDAYGVATMVRCVEIAGCFPGSKPEPPPVLIRRARRRPVFLHTPAKEGTVWRRTTATSRPPEYGVRKRLARAPRLRSAERDAPLSPCARGRRPFARLGHPAAGPHGKAVAVERG